MKAIIALLRGTWWLWLLFVAASIVLSELVDPVFYVMIPVCLVTIVYFAFIRFDSEGKRRTYD